MMSAGCLLVAKLLFLKSVQGLAYKKINEKNGDLKSRLGHLRSKSALPDNGNFPAISGLTVQPQ